MRLLTIVPANRMEIQPLRYAPEVKAEGSTRKEFLLLFQTKTEMREIPSFDENNASVGSIIGFRGGERKRRSDVCEAWGHHYGFICVQAQSLSGRIPRCSHLLDQSSKSFSPCGSFCIFILARGKASNVSLLV